MQKKPKGKEEELKLPDNLRAFDFWFTDEKGTYGPFPCHLEKNQEKARRIYNLNNIQVKIEPAGKRIKRKRAKKGSQHTLIDVPDNTKPQKFGRW